MAQPTVLVGTKLLILVGNGASPEVFAQPCGLTTTGIDFSASTNSTLLPDCEDPEAPAWEVKDINALTASVSGQGVMAVESFDVWNDWFQDVEPRNCQIKLNSSELGYWEGVFIITSLQYGGQRGQKVTLNVTLANSGAVTWVPAT